MPAYKYSYDYDIEEQTKKLPKQKKYNEVPVKKEKPVVEKKEKTLQEKTLAVNFVLLLFGGVLTLVFVTIYSMVALSETRLANLHSEISELNYENIDLENRLENVKSYYSVDTKVSSTASFDKAKNVLEVDKVDAKILEHDEPKAGNLNTVTGF